MRLFHVSEESDITIFKPRIPLRADIDKSKGLIWAITGFCLPNFLTPRNCPRVAYYATEKSSESDKDRFFSSHNSLHVLAIEQLWYTTMKNTILYLYEFDISDFYLQDGIAGYYVSEKEQKPINKIIVTDIFSELFNRNIEVRLVTDLWKLSDDVKKSTLNWSLCRMKNAKKL